MQQKIAHSYTGLLSLSADAIAGDIKNAANVTLAYNNAASITATRNAAELASNAYGAGLTALRNLRRDLDAKMEEGRVFTTLSRDILKPKLGRQFSSGWVETGFERSLEIPESAAKLEVTLERLTAYFEANPANENTSSGVTADAAEALHTSLSNLRQSVRGQATTVRTLKRQRREKFAALRNQMRRLVKELGEKLTPLDERWLDYGLAIPGIKQKPPTPGKVTPMVVNPNTVALKWEPTPRAEYYRIWVRIVGTEDNLVPVGTSQSTSFVLEDLAANVDLEIAISAVNNGGESAQSEIVKVSTAPQPPVATAA